MRSQNPLIFFIAKTDCEMTAYYLNYVPVPPKIVDRDTSSDMVVLESMNVSMTCKAKGYPEPYVMWRREDGENIRYNGENGKRQTTPQ